VKVELRENCGLYEAELVGLMGVWEAETLVDLTGDADSVSTALISSEEDGWTVTVTTSFTVTVAVATAPAAQKPTEVTTVTVDVEIPSSTGATGVDDSTATSV
jgi:hypothetical protein